MVKRLIVCCDGTWDDADAGGSFSNVVRLSRARMWSNDHNMTTQIKGET
jgi:uncharacterized protein (DUF2235 family)